jgi:hypothetical protein
VKNNKIWLTILIILSANTFIKAQKFDIGILAGPQAYKVSFQDKDDRDIYKSKIKLGYRVGGYIIFPLENDFAWSTELFYSKKGRKIENLIDGNINDAVYNFVELSFLIRKQFDLNIIEKVKGKWFFTFGPNINYWLNGRGVWNDRDIYSYSVKFEDREFGDLENNYVIDGNRWLFGIDIGIGIDTPIINSQKFETEIRFTLGQTFLGTKDGSIPNNNFFFDDNLRSNYRSLSLVLRYGLGIDMKNAKKGKSTFKVKRKRR